MCCVCQERRLNRMTLVTWKKRKVFDANALFFCELMDMQRTKLLFAVSVSRWGRWYASFLYIKHWKESNDRNTETGDFQT